VKQLQGRVGVITVGIATKIFETLRVESVEHATN
jgi:hypothetical protein